MKILLLLIIFTIPACAHQQYLDREQLKLEKEMQEIQDRELGFENDPLCPCEPEPQLEFKEEILEAKKPKRKTAPPKQKKVKKNEKLPKHRR